MNYSTSQIEVFLEKTPSINNLVVEIEGNLEKYQDLSSIKEFCMLPVLEQCGIAFYFWKKGMVKFEDVRSFLSFLIFRSDELKQRRFEKLPVKEKIHAYESEITGISLAIKQFERTGIFKFKFFGEERAYISQEPDISCFVSLIETYELLLSKAKKELENQATGGRSPLGQVQLKGEEKFTWKGTPAHLAVIFGFLQDRGYLDIPASSESNAETLFKIFDIKGTPASLAKALQKVANDEAPINSDDNARFLSTKFPSRNDLKRKGR